MPGGAPLGGNGGAPVGRSVWLLLLSRADNWEGRTTKTSRRAIHSGTAWREWWTTRWHHRRKSLTRGERWSGCSGIVFSNHFQACDARDYSRPPNPGGGIGCCPYPMGGAPKPGGGAPRCWGPNPKPPGGGPPLSYADVIWSIIFWALSCPSAVYGG